ncbi:MAG: cell division protein FtsQ/DivIB [Alphaproteobacteria bacterium]|nr:cell division protein FtsQ/DivIB [Alphaproteobacteria bacterium]
MARVKKRKTPLRGSVQQNLAAPERKKRLSMVGKLALMVLTAVAFIFLVSWVWHKRWPHALGAEMQQVFLNVTQKMGFSVRNVLVRGLYYTDKPALLAALDAQDGSPIFAFDPAAAHGAVIALPWVENATIIRSLPDSVLVFLQEHKPMARWQNQERTIVIDDQGRQLLQADPARFTYLPLVVGTAAPEQTKALLALLEGFPDIAHNLQAAVRVSERRWNFHLRQGPVVRLPEYKPERALAALAKLIEEQKILERTDIKTIDLRLPDRIALETIDPTSGSR